MSKRRLNKYLAVELIIAIVLVALTLIFYFCHAGQRRIVKIGSSYMTMNNEFIPLSTNRLLTKLIIIMITFIIVIQL
ncbi:hypothetical protein [Lactobacillus kefiranofaciens]|uniref:hypothetical protein n=1 Tax=Lactobacillus kefiranofaciens TaxID=267818 RepID=UPI002468CC20|nr:hypothetical protein [Lactobacillus kefiranofaciens]